MTQIFKKDQLEIRVYPTRKGMGVSAANDVAVAIRILLLHKPALNMIFASAPSQNEFLDALRMHTDIEWERINAFHMDEYVGLPAEAPQAFGNFLKKKIFDGLPFGAVHYLNGNHPDLKEECRRYTALLRQYPADLVCMGIGENGHIAFNDPHVASFEDSESVKAVDLDERCRMQQVHDGCFASLEEVPTHALTLTVPALMSASRLFCMVPGKTKAWALYHTVTDSVSENIPATSLRRHKHAVIYADADSAYMLADPSPVSADSFR
ncbi:MAG: glucosamine-6-phosphate deaminase [Tannerella sp.]|jgi:glucosamine-6-phosphate deaminase|nr:glucosamine-6-phosphate deaminase [Tannerella sp.]